MSSFKDTAMHGARQVKHWGFLAEKHGRALSTRTRNRVADVINPVRSRISPYSFDPSLYRRSFLVRPAPPQKEPSQLPRQVFMVWTGENDLTPARSRNLQATQEIVGVPVHLVRPENLDDWLLPDHPLHPAYDQLSLVHRSDYLRAYLLHHYGGGYCVIKRALHDWNGSFDALEEHPDRWIIGYPEQHVNDPARLPGRLGHDIRKHYSRLVSSGALITRSHTDFTAEWLREIERRLDYFADQLAEFPGGIRGEVVGYPVSWTDVLGKIYHPLQLKHLPRILQDDRLEVELTDYR